MKGNRTPPVRDIRASIGDGVRFYNRNGDIYIDCLSNLPIFVQAPVHAYSRGDHLTTVYRIPPSKLILYHQVKTSSKIFQKNVL